MMSDLDKFLEERGEIPSGDVAHIKLLAKELALGVHRGLWRPIIHIMGSPLTPHDKILGNYLDRRWESRHKVLHYLELLQGYGYIEYLGLDEEYRLTTVAFDLINEAEPYNIFISYKRSESSALALLVNTKLKEHSLVPFVDMALEAGGNWHAELEGRIRDCDYFIVLLGEKTLASDMTIKEIAWAIQYKKKVIPVWHSEFCLSSDKWNDVDSKVKEAIQRTNAIRVIEESASDYNRAIVELLNRFGITP